MRRWGALVLAVGLLTSCSHSPSTKRVAVKASSRKPVVASADPAGTAAGGTGTLASSVTTTTRVLMTPAEAARLQKCGVPPSGNQSSYPTVPGREENPFGKPDNDFPLGVTVKPTKFGRGDKVHVDTIVGSAQKTVIVVLASFFDDSNHGVKAAKFADKAGKASFDFTIPNDVPLGLGRFVVSASTKDNQTAVEDPKFTVTGPGCA